MVATADSTTAVAAIGLKYAVDRPRPHLRSLVTVPDSPSFPSGHSSTSFACAATLAWLEPRLAAPAVLLATAIAFSRVDVGVHYPLDALGGAALGLAAATALRLLVTGRRRSPRARR
jgi:undecaprenyl-diphosphatase